MTMEDTQKSMEEIATVVATYSREMSLKFASGETVRARIKGRKLKPVCGDLVRAQPLENEPEWLITDVLTRSNELTRPNQRGQIEVLAANLEFLCVVAASTPTPDWFIVDRYLSAAEFMGIDAAVVYNKFDLDTNTALAGDMLGEYRDIGYSTLQCSAKTGKNIDQLLSMLAGKTSIIVGQSGVGKSSLINELTDGVELRIGRISSATGEGKHTTVNSSMIDLKNGGRVIDSPGVRDYAPAITRGDNIVVGFREIADAGQSCRFANCHHLKEPGCEVKRKVEAGEISQRRYESYRRLIVVTEQLTKPRH